MNALVEAMSTALEFWICNVLQWAFGSNGSGSAILLNFPLSVDSMTAAVVWLIHLLTMHYMICFASFFFLVEFGLIHIWDVLLCGQCPWMVVNVESPSCISLMWFDFSKVWEMRLKG